MMRRAALLLGLVITLAAASPAYATNGLVASWPFDEGSGTVVHDVSGNGNDGTISGDAQWVSGFSGLALGFDGSTGRVRVHNSPSLDPATAVSVSAWVRAAQPEGDFTYILAKGASGCLAASYGLYTGPSGGVVFYVARNRGLSYTRSPNGGAGVWNSVWHFVVGTYDGSAVRLYVDGRQVGDGTPGTGPIDYNFPDNDLFIGHYNDCPALDFHGQVDSAQIYNRALSPSEISTEYDQLTGAAGGGPHGGANQTIAPSPPSGGTASSPGDTGHTSSPADTGPTSSVPGTITQSAVTAASISGLSDGNPRLFLRVTKRAGTYLLNSVSVTPPAGLRFAKTPSRVRKGLSLADQPRYLLSLRQGRLMIVFSRPRRSIVLTIGPPALTETSSLVKRVVALVKFNRAMPRAKKKVLELRLGVRLTDVNAKSAAVRLVLRVS